MKTPGSWIMASLAFAFFIMCPRMAGMCAVIAKTREVNPYLIALIGGVISVPLIMLMVFLTIKMGVQAAILVAAATDLLAALAIGTLRPKYALEVLIIALFVWAGVTTANKLSPILEKIIATH